MPAINIDSDENRKSYEKVGLLYNAIKDNEKDIIVRKLMQTEGDINYKISEGSEKVPNLLHIAMEIEGGHLSLLLEHGADFTYKNEKGKTAVHRFIYNPDWMSKSGKTSKNIDLILDAHVKFDNPSNPRDENGMTHFHAACIRNHKSAVEFFLNNGIDVNLPINEVIPPNFSYTYPRDINGYFPRYLGYSPLHLAVKNTCPAVVETLLKHGANMHLKNASGLTSLHLIVKKKMKGSDKSSENEKCKKMFRLFAKSLMNDDRKNMNDVDDYGFSIFHAYCILLEDDSLVASVVKQIKNINQRVNLESPICPGYTPLHFAAYSNVRMFKLLLKNGADVDAKNAKGQTPLDLCLRNHTAEEIHSILLAKSEWKNIVLSDNETMLVDVVPAMKSPDQFVAFLKGTELPASKSIVPFDSPLWPGYALLHLAVLFTENPKHCHHREKSEYALIDECLKRGADMTIQDAKGATPIHLAFYMGKQNVVKFMLDNYDKPDNPADEDNWSLLHIACLVDQEKAVEHLLSNGANVNARVKSTFEYESRGGREKHVFICPGSTPLHVNSAAGYKDVTEILMKYGADVNIQDVYGFTPLHRVLSQESYTYQPLLSAKNLKNITTPHGLSHLHIVSILDHNAEAMDKLLKLGADINAPITYKADDDAKWKKVLRNMNYDPYGDPSKPVAFLSQYAGCTPLHLAFEIYKRYTPKNVRKLLARNADVFARCDRGTLPLASLFKWIQNDDPYFGIINESDDCREFFEKEYGITMLHLACFHGEWKSVKSLIKDGANVNAKVNSDAPLWQGYTPLHFIVKFACENYFREFVVDEAGKIMRSLVKHGADVLSADNNDDTPIHFIKWLDCHPIGFEYKVSLVSPVVSILFENLKNFKVNPVNNQGLSVFHVACLTANTNVIEKFLKHNVDVNQAIGYFSKICSGSTPLHLIIRQYGELYKQSSNSSPTDKAFLQIVDMLLDKGANVNATDGSRNSPLHKAVQLTGLRRILIEKLISNGADVHIANVFGNTAFEDLLSIGDATLAEIDLFLNAGANFNNHNPISQKGYLAIFLHHHRDIRSSPLLMDNQLVLRIMNNPKIIEINDSGRTMIHNLVAIKWKKDFARTCPMLVKLFRQVSNLGFGRRKNTAADDSIYPEMIEQLLIRGCAIDHQDKEGKTALHLAVTFRNNRAIIQLLKNGADINLTDRNGKTAFAYCRESTDRDPFPWYHKELDWDKNYANKLFASLVYKLTYCKQLVNEQNKQLEAKVLKSSGPMKGETLDCFHNEMSKSKRIKIGKTSLSLYEFLTNEDISVVYANMTIEERREFDQLSENMDKYNFREIDCLVKWKYRRTVERKKLIEPALISLNIWANYQLPDIIGRMIFRLLTNEDLKRLIASVD